MVSKAFAAFATLTASIWSLPALSAAADAPAATAAAPAPKLAKNDKSHRICRVVTPSGSRFTSRVCRTAEEWENEARKTQDWVADGNRNGSRRDGEFNTPH
ncbi:MAG: hypothetical protein JWP15_2872 [Alphaproteobacteria bacterium]|nr:hypothetical protein [Alphaproteobacteria bacterium]